MISRLQYSIYLLFVLLIISTIQAQDIPPRPQPPRLVNDFADILTPQEEKALETKLVRFNDTTSNQIAIVTVTSLGDYDPAMFAYRIGENWKIGQKKFDNGVVVLVKPKYSDRERGKAFIAVGYGLEPVIPDAIAKRIVDREMIPAFKNKNYYRGLNNATNILMQLASGEISAKGYNKQTSRSNGLFSIIPFLAILIIIILIRSTGNRSSGMGRNHIPFWTALWLGSSMGSHSGNWGGFSGGGSGFGGGGGFGGFGGGSFGGGGAGGSW